MYFKSPIVTISFRYGMLAATLSIILFSVLYYFGRNPLLIPSFLDFRLLLFPIFLVFSIRDFKENRNNGLLQFWQGFSIGMLIVIIVATSMGLYIYLLGSVIDHNFTSNYVQTTIHNILQLKEKIIAQIGEDKYKKTLQLLPTTTLFDLALDYFIKSFPLGIFLTILISLVLRRIQ